MFPVDPDVPSSITVTVINQTHVTVFWSVDQTNTVNATSIYYRAIDSDNWETPVSASGTNHTVTSLQPGTEYQFYVKITSYGKSSSSQNTTATTGKVVACFGLLLEVVRKLTTIMQGGPKKQSVDYRYY